MVSQILNRISQSVKFFFISTIIFSFGCSDDGEPSPEPMVMDPGVDSILLEMIGIAEEHSINRLVIDWDDLRGEVLERKVSSGSRSKAIRRFLTLLGDNHSFYIRANGDYLFADQNDLQCSVDNVTISESPDDYGYIQVNGFTDRGEEGNAFASEIQSKIAAQASEHQLKWVVDLTENFGGNMYPMIAGLGPFLENNTLGFFIDPTGVESAWGYLDGSSWFDNSSNTKATVSDPFQFEDLPKVAVVFDNSTASSGEATIISFIGRPNTRIFGAASCGVSTANDVFQLSNGDQLILTVSYMADRFKNVYGSQIVPDETFDDSESLKERVIEWLNE